MTNYKIQARPTGKNLAQVPTTKSGFDSADSISAELEEMFIKLKDAIRTGDIELMNVADAFYARGNELKFYIHREERLGNVNGARNSQDPLHLIRTGELEDFLEACKTASELGSRRLSARRLEYEQSLRGLESA